MRLTRSTIFIFAAMLTACITTNSQTAHFYTLATTHSERQTTQSPASAPIAIEVLPVNVPERLKRPQLVITSKNSTQLKILEQYRWASSFNDELQDAFVSGLGKELNAIDISGGGRVANQPIYRIAIVLQQFSATPGQQVEAHFGWTITQLNTDIRSGASRSITCQATISKTVGNDMDAVAKGIQETVTDAIQALAVNVRNLNKDVASKCSD